MGSFRRLARRRAGFVSQIRRGVCVAQSRYRVVKERGGANFLRREYRGGGPSRPAEIYGRATLEPGSSRLEEGGASPVSPGGSVFVSPDTGWPGSVMRPRNPRPRTNGHVRGVEYQPRPPRCAIQSADSRVTPHADSRGRSLAFFRRARNDRKGHVSHPVRSRPECVRALILSPEFAATSTTISPFLSGHPGPASLGTRVASDRARQRCRRVERDPPG